MPQSGAGRYFSSLIRASGNNYAKFPNASASQMNYRFVVIFLSSALSNGWTQKARIQSFKINFLLLFCSASYAQNWYPIARFPFPLDTTHRTTHIGAISQLLPVAAGYYLANVSILALMEWILNKSAAMSWYWIAYLRENSAVIFTKKSCRTTCRFYYPFRLESFSSDSWSEWLRNNAIVCMPWWQASLLSPKPLG